MILMVVPIAAKLFVLTGGFFGFLGYLMAMESEDYVLATLLLVASCNLFGAAPIWVGSITNLLFLAGYR